MQLINGIDGAYEWLEADHDLNEFKALCPDVIKARYVVITAVDSGSFRPSPEDKRNGWAEDCGIAYSPLIESVSALPADCCCRDCCGFDEWYVFENPPRRLGSFCRDNVFEAALVPGNVFRFINFGGFRFSDGRMKALVDLFWIQMDWISPETYVADGENCLIFATRNPDLFRVVQETLSNSPSKHSELK